MDWGEAPRYWLTRFCFQRALGFIYFIGFLVLVRQGRALIGERGLLPAPLFVKRRRFRDAPSLFFLRCTDRTLALGAWAGLVLSVVAVSGVSDAYGFALSVAVWASLWMLYLSFVNVGQTFYAFGWESMLLEAGFLAIFLGPSRAEPPVLVIWLLRWMLFRVMFGAGLIKLRGDECWRKLTCLDFHFETQPLPNPFSRAFHRLPRPVLHAGVLYNHLVELVVPFGYFWPQGLRYTCAGLTASFQLILIVSGNLSWLNYLTLVLCIPVLDDALLSRLLPLVPPAVLERSEVHHLAVLALTALVGVLSLRPALNLLSRRQAMNLSYDPLHLVNTYGAFGGVTRERLEVVLEGTDALALTPDARWREYEFKGKPGETRRRPPIVSPYHYRLDWQMWFAPMSSYAEHPWILNLVARLLQGDEAVLRLLRKNPFPATPPRHVRAELYLYRFSRPGEEGWWVRTRLGAYLPPLSLEHPGFRWALQELGWLEEDAEHGERSVPPGR
jgi:hypothetical protein